MSRLTNRKLNKLLKDAVDKIEVPDVKDKAKKTPIFASNSPVQSAAKKNVSVTKKRAFVSLVCACCIIAVCTTLGIVIPNQNGGGAPNVCYVTVDVNPSVTIKVVNGKVEDVVNNNKEGGVVLAGISNLSSLKGGDVNRVIDAVLDSCLRSGYLVYGNAENEKSKNAVRVGVVNDDYSTEKSNQAAKDVSNSVKSFFKNRNLYALVVADSEVKRDYDKIYNEYGITLSKYNLIKSVYIAENNIYNVFTSKFEDSDKFKKFVKDNKNVRVSTLYARIDNANNSDSTSKKIFEVIYTALKDDVGYSVYLKDNVGKVNEDLDKYISDKTSGLITTIIGGVGVELDKIYYQNLLSINLYFKNKLAELNKAIEELKITIEGVSDEVIGELHAWVNGILGISPSEDNSENEGQDKGKKGYNDGGSFFILS